MQSHCILLDLSKAFDRVWHEIHLCKLRKSGINGDFTDLIESFLHLRRQRVVLTGQSSNSKFVYFFSFILMIYSKDYYLILHYFWLFIVQKLLFYYLTAIFWKYKIIQDNTRLIRLFIHLFTLTMQRHCKLQPIVPRRSLSITCKSFIRHHLDYGNVICDRPPNSRILQFQTKLGNITGH